MSEARDHPPVKRACPSVKGTTFAHCNYSNYDLLGTHEVKKYLTYYVTKEMTQKIQVLFEYGRKAWEDLRHVF